MKRLAARILSHLARFAVFNAVMFAVLFGLPALAEHHPLAFLGISLSVLILTVYATHKPAAKPKAVKRHATTHHKAA